MLVLPFSEALKKEMPVYSLLLLLRAGAYKSLMPKEEARFYIQLLAGEVQERERKERGIKFKGKTKRVRRKDI